MIESVKILLIENNSGDAALIQDSLEKITSMDVVLNVVDTLESAQISLNENKIDLILIGITLVDVSDLEAFNEMHNLTPSVPFIVLIRYLDAKRSVETFNSEAHNYLIKELINTEVLAHSISSAVSAKYNQEALKDSESRLQRAQHLAGLGFLTWDLKTNGIEWSDEVFNIYGVDKEKVQPTLKYTISLVHPDDVKYVQDSLDAAVEGQTDYNIDHRIIRPDGEIIWVHAHAEMIYDSNGTKTHLLGTVLDITNRKNSEEQILESEERWRTLAQTSPDHILYIDCDLIIQFANRPLPGTTLEEIVGSSIIDFVPEDDQKKVEEILTRIIKTGEPIIYETVYNQPRVDAIHYETNAEPWIVKDRIVGAILASRNITNRKQIEKALISSEQRNRMIVYAMSDLVLVHDLDGTYQEYYAKDDSLLVRPWSEMKGKNQEEIIPQAIVEMHKANVRQLLETGENTVSEFQLESQGIMRWLQATNMLHEDGQRIIAAVKDITSRKNAEIALIESEARLKLAGKVSYDLIYEWNTDTDSVDWFGDIDGILGYDQGEISRNFQNWLNAIHPDDTKKLVDTMDLHQKSGNPFNYEYRILRKDGTIRYWNDRATPILDDMGNVHKWVGVCTDITEKKRTEFLLLEERDRAQNYLDVAGVIMLALDQNGNVSMINKKGCEVLGWDYDEIIGVNWFENCLPKEIKGQVKDGIFKPLMEGEEKDYTYVEEYIITKQGNLKLIAWNNTILRDNDGRIIGTLSSGEDITEKKKYEAALTASEHLNRLIVDAMSDLVIVFDSEGRYSEYYAQDESLLVQPWNQLKGKKPGDILSSELVAQHDAHMKHTQETGESIVYEFELETRDGLKWLQATMMFHEDTKEFVSSVTDITDRKLAEELLRESEQRNRIIADAMSDLILIYDNDERLVEYFTTDVSLLYLPWSKMKGSRVEDIMPSAIVDLHNNAMQRVRDSREPVSYEYELEIENTLRWFRATIMLHEDKEGFVVAVKDITQTIAAERDTQYLASLILNVSDAIISTDLEYKVRSWNKAAEEIYGWKAEEVIGKPLEGLLHSETVGTTIDDSENQLKETGRWEGDARQKTKDGHIIYVQASVSVLKDKDGTPYGTVAVNSDITERVRAEEAQREIEKRHRLVLSSISDLIFVIDKKNNYREFYASDQFRPISSPDEFIGKSIKDVMPLDVADRIIECINQVRKTRNRETLEYSLTSDGVEDWFHAALDMHDDGESIVMVSRNINERKKAEKDAKELESEYQTLVSNIPGVVYHCAFDEYWTMFYLSDAIQEISGYPSSDFIMNQTRSFTSIIHPDDREIVRDEITKSVEKHERYTIEYRIIRLDGKIRWIREYGKEISEVGEGIAYLDGVLFDITEEKTAEDEMAHLRQVQDASFNLALALGESLNLNKIYTTVYKHIKQLMDSNFFSVFIYNRKNNWFVPEYAVREEIIVNVQNLQPIILGDEDVDSESQVVLSGKSLYIPNFLEALKNEEIVDNLILESSQLDSIIPDDSKQHAKSAVYVPLLYAKDVIGVLNVKSYNINAYSQEQLELLSNLANVVAMSLQNAKLYDNLAESKDRFRILVEGTLDGVFIHENLVFLDMNQSMAEMIGKSRIDLIGTNVSEYWTQKSQMYFQSNSEGISELDLLRSDGSIYRVEALSKNCLFDGKKARIVAIRNISEAKKAQQATKQAADTALLYLDIMSHDIRNQLQAIIMASEILENSIISDEDKLAFNIITQSIVRSQMLINKVLSTRDLLSVPLSKFSLNTAMQNSVEAIKRIFKDIEIEVKYLSIDLQVNADIFIERLIMNILENAILYNERTDRKVWVNLKKSKRGYQLSIADNGQGIDDEMKESLFDPSRRFGGIGIHQTLRILQKYGGSISVHDRVKSDFKQGTEFRLWFPQYE